MKLNSVLSAVAAAGLFSLATAPAHALIVQDAWQLNLTGAGIASNTTNIGHLNLSGGLATITQQVACGPGGCAPFVGAQFSEFGQIFTATYTPESGVGATDAGPTQDLNNKAVFGNNLAVVFTGLSGTVSAFNGVTGAISFAFTPGVGSIQLRTNDPSNTLLANFSLVAPSNGSLSNINGTTGTTGTSDIIAQVISAGYTPGLFRDSTGVAYNPFIPGVGDLFFDVITDNKIQSAFVGPTACGFGEGLICITGNVRSDGSADLLRIPEPASLALFGIALAGIGASARRRKQSS